MIDFKSKYFDLRRRLSGEFRFPIDAPTDHDNASRRRWLYATDARNLYGRSYWASAEEFWPENPTEKKCLGNVDGENETEARSITVAYDRTI